MKSLFSEGSEVSRYESKQRILSQYVARPLVSDRSGRALVSLALTCMILVGDGLTGFAEQDSTAKPKITGVELLNKKEDKKPASPPAATPVPALPAMPTPAPSARKKTKKQIAAEQKAAAQAAARAAAAQVAAAQTAQLQAAQIRAADKKTTFYLQITGEHLEGVKKDDVHLFSPLNQEVRAIENVQPAGDAKILVKVTADVPMEIMRIVIKGSETQEFRLAITEKKEESVGFKEIETTFETFKSPTFPNQYTIFVTKKGGAGSFESDPNRMRVEVLPPGASNVTIRQGSNPQQLVVDFLAPDKFEVKNIIVTIYDSGNLDSRKVIAVATPFKEKPAPADPNQPVINGAELIYIQRGRGFGRLKIEGSGFGDYERLPMTTEEILRTCFPRYIGTEKTGGIKAPLEMLNDLVAEINKGTDPDKANQLARIDRLRQGLLKREVDLAGDTGRYFVWREQLNQLVKIELVPRNPDLKLDTVDVLYIDDKLIDVYFEFHSLESFVPPFRLASTTVTVKKNGAKTAQTVKDGDVIITLSKAGTFSAGHDIGPKKDQNLRYSYSLMDHDQANNLFGRGVADSFYVIELTVTNTGAKKVAVPLAAIQAEVEWLKGEGKHNAHYSEGPDTMPPIPLESVSGFFDAYLKTIGTRAKIFNALGGIASLGAAVIPFVGPSFKDGVTVLSSAGIPALKIITGDLSGQQLQRLASLSWQNIEVVAPGGNSIIKYIYIQRGAGEFSLGPDVPFKLKRQIGRIVGIEVVGFEVVESEAKQATPTQSNPNP